MWIHISEILFKVYQGIAWAGNACAKFGGQLDDFLYEKVAVAFLDLSVNAKQKHEFKHYTKGSSHARR